MPSADRSDLKRVRKLATCESGQATVEFALVLPFLFLFSLSVVQVGSIANDQLAYHAHLERRRMQDTNARQLPVRLLLPLTCCILPSFVLLAMIPLVVNSLSAVSAQLF